MYVVEARSGGFSLVAKRNMIFTTRVMNKVAKKSACHREHDKCSVIIKFDVVDLNHNLKYSESKNLP